MSWSVATKKYCWKKDSIDERDYKKTFTIPNFQNSIKHVDLRNKCPPIYDQGQLGSCTANAIAAVYEFDQIKENEKEPFVPSRLFIYYNEREMEGTIESDSGAEIRDGIKSINKIGLCPESEWTYDITKFAIKPNDECYKVALNHKSVKYTRLLQDLEQLKQCLIEGYPFVFGITVFESFESSNVAKTGVVPMPAKNEKQLGGHAIVCVGFNDDTKQFIIRNSWGTTWGDKGYGYLPYEYMINSELASDFWVVTRVQDLNNDCKVEYNYEPVYLYYKKNM
jgi:C1A family cysteine protease